MKILDIIQGKKAWKAHNKRVKALPKDYQIVYKEIQKYLFKTGPIVPMDGTKLLSEIVDYFEESVALEKGVLDVIGHDVASFCDELTKEFKTYNEIYKESVVQKVKKALK